MGMVIQNNCCPCCMQSNYYFNDLRLIKTIFFVWWIIFVCLSVGNGIVLISVKYRFHARSYSDYFIVSLCLADFFVGLFVMPLMTIHSLNLRWPFHYNFCYIWMSIDFTCSTASFLTLASMALDRYYALTGKTKG
jgi:hypothetical protein